VFDRRFSDDPTVCIYFQEELGAEVEPTQIDPSAETMTIVFDPFLRKRSNNDTIAPNPAKSDLKGLAANIPFHLLGAHRLLQVRTELVDGRLGDAFARCYSEFVSEKQLCQVIQWTPPNESLFAPGKLGEGGSHVEGN
jgi:hypothetical protein